VLSGTGSFNIDGEEVRVAAEDLLIVPRGTPYDRLSTARRADRILVLDAGRIVEAGDYATWLARGGTSTAPRPPKGYPGPRENGK